MLPVVIFFFFFNIYIYTHTGVFPFLIAQFLTMSEMDPRKGFPYPSICKEKVSSVYTFALFQPNDDFFPLSFLFTSFLHVYF